MESALLLQSASYIMCTIVHIFSQVYTCTTNDVLSTIICTRHSGTVAKAVMKIIGSESWYEISNDNIKAILPYMWQKELTLKLDG